MADSPTVSPAQTDDVIEDFDDDYDGAYKETDTDSPWVEASRAVALPDS